MDIKITPAKLCGTVDAVPSKSAAHRLLVLAALADRPTLLLLKQSNDDIDATARCLRALGAGIAQESLECWRVTPLISPAANPCLDCGESGSTLRFLMPVAAALGVGATFAGAGRLPLRPLGTLREILSEGGCTFTGDTLPLTLSGQLRPGDYALPGNISSQYITGLLLALPLLEGDSTITLTTPLESAGYVALTLDALTRFGITVTPVQNRYLIPGGQRPRSPGTLTVEGDWSSAAFWLAAGALGGDISCTGLEIRSAQGDRSMADLLTRMGGVLRWDNGNLLACAAALTGCDINAEQIPDLVPVLAAVAALAHGTTRITRAGRLRDKESDRLIAVCRELTALGAHIRELPDGLYIEGATTLSGGQADGWGDHRIVMAMAVAACGCTDPVIIRGVEAVAKSYPAFFDDYKRLGGIVDVL